MPPQESKPADPAANADEVADDVSSDGDSGDEVPADASGEASAAAAAAAKKKRRNKKKKGKAAVAGGDAEGNGKELAQPNAAGQKITRQQLESIAQFNPMLKQQLQGATEEQINEMLQNLTLGDLLTGATGSGKNRKDMAAYKFWSTQPVPSFDDVTKKADEGPIEEVDLSKIPKEPAPLPAGYEWSTLDLENPAELEELYKLLSDHYVEDGEAMFRFNYSAHFLRWALMSPGWQKHWHVGVRATESRRLVASITAIPARLRLRTNWVECAEVNFMCVHKKLRSKRLAPVLIREITRRCNETGIFQAIYTGGAILPTPVATCRYFHRALDWEKLFEVGFSGLPPGSTKQRQILRNRLPTTPQLPGWRPMEQRDVETVRILLNQYLEKQEMAQEFTHDELTHWVLQPHEPEQQVVWAYVVEDPRSGQVTDFASFYCLESTAIGNPKYPLVRAAYLYYYASETALGSDRRAWRSRLNEVMHDTLICAKKANFDVFNALTMMENPLFLEEQKFGPGDGSLHYYLFNYRCAPMKGGIDPHNKLDEKQMNGIGLVML